nr:4-alpha-glucanotransferase [Corynebacterium sp. 76QC2CO]
MSNVGYIDTLRQLAASYAVTTSYQGFGGKTVEVSEDTLVKTLRSLGVRFGNEDQAPEQPEFLPIDAPMPSEEQIQRAITRREDEEFSRPLPRTLVGVAGTDTYVNVHVHDGQPAELVVTLEDGAVLNPEQVENWTQPREIDGVTWGEATFRIPGDTPLGWHTLTLTSPNLTSSCTFVNTPARLSTTDALINSPVAGMMAQIYSVRSNDSWGIGDFRDMANLATVAAKDAHCDFLLVNPMHAAEPFPPVEDSPYLPTSRRFTNPLYIRVEDIPELEALSEDLREDVFDIAAEFTALNREAEEIDRNPIYAAKLQVLREIYAAGREPAREQDFQDYIAREGHGLADFALWCAAQESAQQASVGDHAIVEDPQDLAEFYMWLQWICDQQLAAAQSAAKDAGMRIGIMADLAVGVHPAGADAHNNAPVLAPSSSVGAPPDNYNQQGQDWSQPPWHPDKLAESGYVQWRDLLRTVLRHSGGIRVDHILGLFRLYWIPRTQLPTTGTYVNYDHNALVGILALEAERAGAVVIGEDLGTFEPWVQEFLAQRGIMGTSILWFEANPEGEGARHQHQYRTAALTSVTTHDLPPTAGFLAGEHITLRERLGILTTDAAEEEQQDAAWQAEVLDRVRQEGAFGDAGFSFGFDSFQGRARDERGDTKTLIEGLHRFVAGTPSALTCASLVDMVGDRRAQNQPGTTKDQYPNWCIPLTDYEGKALVIEDLPTHPWFRDIAEAAKR